MSETTQGSNMQIKIDPEFRKHLLPLDVHEKAFLEGLLTEHGCTDALVIWEEESILIDGHNRHEICTRLGLPFDTRTVSLPDREAVLDWMDKNQVGRRNMTVKDLEIVRGRIYNRRKKKVNDGGQGKPRSGVQSEPHLKTAAVVASELEVSPSSVKRSGKRAEVYDAMLDLEDEEAAKAARSATHEEIKQASKKEPAEAAEELKAKAKEKAEPRKAPKKKADKPKQVEADETSAIETQGVGITRAHQAIACLKKIPKGDPLRKRAFEIVSDYIKQNR